MRPHWHLNYKNKPVQHTHRVGPGDPNHEHSSSLEYPGGWSFSRWTKVSVEQERARRNRVGEPAKEVIDKKKDDIFEMRK